MKTWFSLLLVGGLAIAPNVLTASTHAETLVAQGNQGEYWQDSVDLVQEQIDLLNRIERSLYDPQRSAVQGSFRQLFFYLGRLDRYVAQYDQSPNATCGKAALDPTQTVYCTLWRSRGNLYTLLDTTRQRLEQLGTGEDSLLFPVGAGSLLSAEIIPQETWQSQSQLDLVIPNDAKLARDSGEIPRPAIAPLPNTSDLIQIQKRDLLALQTQFPAGFTVEDIDVFATGNVRYEYKPLPQEYQQYQSFLAESNTGISRLLPQAAYMETATSNSLLPTIKEQYPLPQFNAPKPFPNLPLVIQNEQLVFMPEGFNLSLIQDLGEKEFNALSKINQDLPLLTYQSPNTFQGLQQTQRQFLFNKTTKFVQNTAPLTLNHLYLVRLIQYEFAPEILEGKLLPRQRFRELNDLANPPSYDVLVAVKPVHRWLDGSYTLLWQVIDQKPATPIVDLADYITVQSPLMP